MRKLRLKFLEVYPKKNLSTFIYPYRRINNDSRSIFDADQHAEIHLAGNDYGFALIYKEGTKGDTYKTDFS